MVRTLRLRSGDRRRHVVSKSVLGARPTSRLHVEELGIGRSRLFPTGGGHDSQVDYRHRSLQRGEEDMAPVNCKEENSFRESDCAIHSVRRLLPADYVGVCPWIKL